MTIATLDLRIEQGTVTRHKWEGTDDKGRHTACLWVALVEGIDGMDPREPAACPALNIPEWWAKMTPWIDDAGSLEAWPGVVRKYAACAKRWRVFTDADWALFSRRVRTIIVQEARTHVSEQYPDVLAACDRMIGVLTRDDATDEEYRAAAEAAGAAAWAAWAAEAAEAAGAAEAAEAAWAAWAAGAAGAARAAEAARAVEAAEAASADRMISAILTELDTMLGWSEARNAADIAAKEDSR
ncbi:MAG: hypothetical protein IPK85_03435 [Gemmatimonadetes bacterium]|nr:hypothetical protein [Gemmatimonadota bacterium]